MAQDTFYQNVGGSGYIDNGDDVWATCRDALTGQSIGGGTYNLHYLRSIYDAILHYNYYVSRVFIPFDTSSIPDGNVITAVQLKVYVKKLGAVSVIAGLVQSTQALPTALTLTDFDQVGSTEGATRLIWTTEGWKTFDLNTVGLSWISKTGYTKLALRDSKDIDNTTPINSNAYYLKTVSHPSQLIVTHYPVINPPIGFLEGKRKSGGFLTGLKQTSKNDMLKKTGGVIGSSHQESKYQMKRKPGGFLGGSKKAQ